MLVYNMGWVFATYLQEGLSPTPTLWWPDLFYFPFLYHCQNADPLIRFLVFITCRHQMDLNSFRNNQFAFGLCSKMPSHYSFHLPSMHSIIFQSFQKAIPLILESVDQFDTTEPPGIRTRNILLPNHDLLVYFNLHHVTKFVTVIFLCRQPPRDSSKTEFPFALLLRPHLWVTLPSRHSFYAKIFLLGLLGLFETHVRFHELKWRVSNKFIEESGLVCD